MDPSRWTRSVVVRGFVAGKKNGMGGSGKPYYCVTVGTGALALNFFVDKVEYDSMQENTEVEVECNIEASQKDRDAVRLRWGRLVGPTAAAAAPGGKRF